MKPTRTCAVDGCDARHVARGWCRKHWQRWKRGGDPNTPSIKEMSVVERFWAKVEKTDTCWNWIASKDWDGYGIFTDEGRVTVRAHRWSYTQAHGVILDGLVIDHLCRNVACVNPDHLEPVTSAVNTSRSPYTLSTQNAAKSQCPYGHAYDRVHKNGHRICSICDVYAKRRYRGWSEERIRTTPIPTPGPMRTHCPQKHPYDEANTYFEKGGSRKCRACRAQRLRDYRARKRSTA